MEPWLVILIGIQTAFLAFVIWLVVHYRTAKARRRADERMRLLERFESSEDLERFLGSEAGQTYLKASEVTATDSRKWIVLSVALGVVALALGGGMAFLTFGDFGADGMIIPGAILSSFGIGLFGAALVSIFLLRRLGNGSDEPS